MEHIVQFGINIDDDAIRKTILKNAEQKITEDIKLAVQDKIFEKRNYYAEHADPECDKLTFIALGIVRDVISSRQNEIIDRAALYLAESVKRTKIWKEQVAQEIGR